MSTFNNTALTANNILTGAITDRFGFGSTLNPDGSLNAILGATIRYVTVAPTQVDNAGSLALRSNGTLYSTTGAGVWFAIGGGGSGWNLPDNIPGIWGTTAPLQATSVYTSATKLWGLTSANWSAATAPVGVEPGSVGFTFSTGTTTNTGAVVGFTSGGYAWATGATAQTTAAGTGGASGGYTWATGASTVNLAAGGATGGASGGYGWTTGNTDATGAAGNTAGVSGGFAWATGNTDNNSTGGFGANSGGYNFATGNCLSGVGAASGTSGSFTFGTGSSADLNTGGYTWTTGNATAGNSGGFVFTVGTAGGTRGLMDWNFTTLDTVTQAFFWDLIDNNAAGLTMRAGTGGLTILSVVTTDLSEAFNFAARLTTTDAVVAGTAKVVGGRSFAALADSTALNQATGAMGTFDVSFAIPANTLKAGTVLRIRAVARVTVAINGANATTVNLRVGGTNFGVAVSANTSVAGVRCSIDCWLVARAAPGAAVAISGVGTGIWSDNPAVTTVTPAAGVAVPTLATNGALTVDATASCVAVGDGSGRVVLEQLTVEVL